MRIVPIVRNILFFLFILGLGRFVIGVSAAWMSLFILFVVWRPHPILFVLMCVAVDLFFFVPLGITLLVLGIAGLVFPYVYGKSLFGFAKTIVFFSAFSLIAFVVYPHVTILSVVSIIFFSLFSTFAQVQSSHIYEVG